MRPEWLRRSRPLLYIHIRLETKSPVVNNLKGGSIVSRREGNEGEERESTLCMHSDVTIELFLAPGSYQYFLESYQTS